MEPNEVTQLLIRNGKVDADSVEVLGNSEADTLFLEALSILKSEKDPYVKIRLPPCEFHVAQDLIVTASSHLGAIRMNVIWPKVMGLTKNIRGFSVNANFLPSIWRDLWMVTRGELIAVSSDLLNGLCIDKKFSGEDYTLTKTGFIDVVAWYEQNGADSYSREIESMGPLGMAYEDWIDAGKPHFYPKNA